MFHRFPDLPRQEHLERPPLAEDPAVAARVQRARHLAMLESIVEMAMDLAQGAYRRAKAEEAAALADVAAQAKTGAKAGAKTGAKTGAAGGAGPVSAGPDDDADDDRLVREGPAAEDRLEARIDELKGALAAGGAGLAGGGDERAGAIPPRGDPSLVFARLSRVLFRALALAERLREAGKLAAEADSAAASPDYVMTPERKAKIMARWDLLLTRKNLVVDIVRDALETQKPDATADVVCRALNDRLLEFERFEVLNDTLRVSAQRWCDKLGLVLDWDRWKDEAWAIKEEDGLAEWVEYRGGAP